MENTIEQFEPKHNDVFDLWAIVSVRGRGGGFLCPGTRGLFC